MTRLLLDTHLVLWWLSDDPRLPQAVEERLQEMAIKCGLGRLQVDLPVVMELHFWPDRSREEDVVLERGGRFWLGDAKWSLAALPLGALGEAWGLVPVDPSEPEQRHPQ